MALRVRPSRTLADGMRHFLFAARKIFICPYTDGKNRNCADAPRNSVTSKLNHNGDAYSFVANAQLDSGLNSETELVLKKNSSVQGQCKYGGNISLIHIYRELLRRIAHVMRLSDVGCKDQSGALVLVQVVSQQKAQTRRTQKQDSMKGNSESKSY
eukprot:6178640-Pleurochrysis_carterae.AAC.3